MENKKLLLILAALGLVGVAAYVFYNKQVQLIDPAVTAASTEMSKLTRDTIMERIR